MDMIEMIKINIIQQANRHNETICMVKSIDIDNQIRSN